MSDPNGWVPIGPSCVPNGQLGREDEGVGPISGRCTAIALDPTQPDQIIYIGTAIGGVWKSTDGGLTWKPKTDFEACLGIGCVTIDPTNRLRLYVGTGEANEGGEIIPGVGVLVSADGGDTWVLRGNATFAGTRIGQIVVDPTSPADLYAASSGGLFHSPDSGVTWNPINVSGANVWITGLYLDTSEPANKRLYAAVVSEGVYRRDGAGAFAKLSNNAPTAGIFRVAVAVAPSNPQIVYAAFGRTATHKHDLLGVWKSTNRGDRWEQVSALPLPRHATTGQTGYNLALTVDPMNPDRVFLGEVRFWRTTNGGQSWEVVSEPHGNSIGLHADQHVLVFNPTNTNKIWVGDDGGVFFSDDGGNIWSHRNRGLQTLQYYALALHPTRESITFVGSQDNGLQRHLGHPSWQKVRGGDGFYCAIDPLSPTTWYGSYTFESTSGSRPISAAIYRSTEAGQDGSFEDIADDSWLTDYSSGAPFYLPFVHSPTEAGIVYIGTTRLYRRRTSPAGWETVTLRAGNTPFSTGVPAGATITRTSRETITAIAVSRSNPSLVYVGTADGRFFRLERGGDQLWTMVDRTAGLPAIGNSDVISDIAVHPTDPDRVYVAIGYAHLAWSVLQPIATGRIFFSANAGQAWQARGSGQMNVNASGIVIDHRANPVNAITIDQDNPTHVYIGCDVGLFRSTDEGATWAPWHQNLPNSSVSDLQIHPPTRIIRATTRGRSTWERRLDVPAAAPPLVDLYLRDNPIDVARRDTPVDEADPLNSSKRVKWHSSADIKLDAPSFFNRAYQKAASTVDYTDGGAIDFIGFERLEHEDPREEDEVKVYVQLQNRGPDPATNVKVRVFFNAKVGDNYPDLPADFWAAFPDANSATPALWVPIGPAITVPEIRPTEPSVVSWNWTVPGNAGSTVGLLGVVTNAQDPVNETRRAVQDVARTNKHVALREISPGMSRAAIFVLVLLGIGVAAVVTAGVVSEAT
jgi:photosystem II stability/assembly factor-like uncharacterized protein